MPSARQTRGLLRADFARSRQKKKKSGKINKRKKKSPVPFLFSLSQPGSGAWSSCRSGSPCIAAAGTRAGKQLRGHPTQHSFSGNCRQGSEFRESRRKLAEQPQGPQLPEHLQEAEAEPGAARFKPRPRAARVRLAGLLLGDDITLEEFFSFGPVFFYLFLLFFPLFLARGSLPAVMSRPS